MEENNTHIFSQAKMEYTNQLIDVFTPHLFDGRKSKMSVDMINANMIEKVEVMTTPSSKYDPDGIAGIINIVLNKNEYVGKSGNIGINIDINTNFGIDTNIDTHIV